MIDKLISDNRLLGDLYEGINGKDRSRLNELIRALYSGILKKYSVVGNAEKYTFFFTSSRSDYKKLIESIYNQCPFEKSWMGVEIRKGIDTAFLIDFFSNIHLLSKLSEIKLSPHITEQHTKIISLGFIQRLTMYSRLIKCLQKQKAIEKHDFSNTKVSVTLCDVWSDELLFQKYMKTLNVHTVTAQHGLFICRNANPLNYTNLEAQDILAWGEQMRQLTNQYSPQTNVYVCGQPILEPLSEDVSFNFFGIVLDGKQSRTYNQEMIEYVQRYAKKNGIKILIRLHPNDDKDNYKIDTNVSSYENNLNQCRIIFGHTSSMLFSYMAQGKNILRYASDEKLYIPSKNEKNIFSSFEELEKKIDKEIIVKDHFLIDCIGNESRKKYKEAFEMIEGSL